MKVGRAARRCMTNMSEYVAVAAMVSGCGTFIRLVSPCAARGGVGWVGVEAGVSSCLYVAIRSHGTRDTGPTALSPALSARILRLSPHDSTLRHAFSRTRLSRSHLSLSLSPDTLRTDGKVHSSLTRTRSKGARAHRRPRLHSSLLHYTQRRSSQYRGAAALRIERASLSARA